MQSLLAIFQASPNYSLTQCCCKPPNSSCFKVSGLQNSGCLSFLGPNGNVKLSSSSGSRSRRRLSQVVKASDAEEVQKQNEVSQQEAQIESKSVVGTKEQNEPPSVVATAQTTQKEGVKTGEFWSLRSANDDGKGQKIVTGDGLLIGAAPRSDGSSIPFMVDFPGVSSTHARVFGRERKTYKSTEVEYYVKDLGSTNGTYLNRSKLRPQTEVKLSRGDTLKFGDENAVFVVESQS